MLSAFVEFLIHIMNYSIAELHTFWYFIISLKLFLEEFFVNGILLSFVVFDLSLGSYCDLMEAQY